MDLIFKYKQATFLRAQQIDRNFHSGLCFIMCIDYIYNKKHNLPCDFYIFVKPGSLLQDIGRCYIYIRAENILEILI